jgi:hypothetical protein
MEPEGFRRMSQLVTHIAIEARFGLSVVCDRFLAMGGRKDKIAAREVREAF